MLDGGGDDPFTTIAKQRRLQGRVPKPVIGGKGKCIAKSDHFLGINALGKATHSCIARIGWQNLGQCSANHIPTVAGRGPFKSIV